MKVLSASLDGVIWDKESQALFQMHLIKNRLYGLDSPEFRNNIPDDLYSKFSDVDHEISIDDVRLIVKAKNYQDFPMRGRTSFAPLKEFGLVNLDSEGRVEITSSGRFLLNGGEYDEFLLKAFLKWQYSNPTNSSFPQDYQTKPFVSTMHLIRQVNNICEKTKLKIKGISKLEFQLFALTLVDYTQITQTASELVNFRKKLENCYSQEERGELVNLTYSNNSSGFKTKIEHLKDYADNAIRWFRCTKFFILRGDDNYIDLEPRKTYEINKILEAYSGDKEDDSTYVKRLQDISCPTLPWETNDQLSIIRDAVLADIKKLQKDLQVSVDVPDIQKLPLKNQIVDLRAIRNEITSLEIKDKYKDDDYVSKLIHSLRNIRELERPPVALEEITTNMLRIINDAIAINTNAPLGDDNRITFSAPGGVADIECFYKKYAAIYEVTLLTSRGQWYNEGQPVMRHLRDFEDKHADKFRDFYCIFISPRLHEDTLNTFWTSNKYEYRGRPQKIIPLNIDQFIKIFEFTVKQRKANVQNTSTTLQKLFDSISKSVSALSSSDLWKNAIDNQVNELTVMN
ncbi:AlwI family type II restriction endonuclease [Polynucleobacter paneuropaeus]|nr:AlwI family type II restriction endonuclease [Polynucleobacter paneuropaeus]MBT8638856.1 AlwI family type II restriction endonuclease [Polynucleobacter paneuropaeus]